MEDAEHGASWEPVPFKGQVVPGNISHHRPAVFGSSVVVFGGINGTDNQPSAFEFDSVKQTWSALKQTGSVPKARDDHSLS